MIVSRSRTSGKGVRQMMVSVMLQNSLLPYLSLWTNTLIHSITFFLSVCLSSWHCHIACVWSYFKWPTFVGELRNTAGSCETSQLVLAAYVPILCISF